MKDNQRRRGVEEYGFRTCGVMISIGIEGAGTGQQEEEEEEKSGHRSGSMFN
jgi:hypothetical protein